MATKNLARSVIEGGRSFYNSWTRRNSHRIARTHVREQLDVVRSDPESSADSFFSSPRHVRKSFHDKLSPAYRFLDSRVGKSWNKTLSIIAERFDTRTTAGRHIVFDHMIAEVAPSQAALAISRRALYFVDARGILRVAASRPRIHRVSDPPPVRWLGNRKLGRLGTLLAWFVPTRDADRVTARWTGSQLVYVMTDGTSAAHVGFRQSRALDASECATFESLSSEVQRIILAAAPV